MSACFTLKADTCVAPPDVRFGAKADNGNHIRSARAAGGYLEASCSGGRGMSQSIDRRIKPIPSAATFQTRERSRKTPAA
jgi:hypothetical protein